MDSSSMYVIDSERYSQESAQISVETMLFVYKRPGIPPQQHTLVALDLGSFFPCLSNSFIPPLTCLDHIFLAVSLPRCWCVCSYIYIYIVRIYLAISYQGVDVFMLSYREREGRGADPCIRIGFWFVFLIYSMHENKLHYTYNMWVYFCNSTKKFTGFRCTVSIFILKKWCAFHTPPPPPLRLQLMYYTIFQQHDIVHFLLFLKMSF